MNHEFDQYRNFDTSKFILGSKEWGASLEANYESKSNQTDQK